MQTNLIHQALEAARALRQRFAPPPAAVSQGHDPRWREQQLERGEREQALYQLRVLGWPGA